VPFKAHALQHLQLKTVVKESHCSQIHAVQFNHLDSNVSNLFATVGKDQATVYDDAHMGDYVCVVVHFTNAATSHHTGGDLSTCTWMDAKGLSNHQHGDAYLAVAGSDKAIQVISVAESAAIALLKGRHDSDVVDLSSAPEVPGLLLSMSKDGHVCIWDAPSETCLASVRTNAFTAELHPSGKFFVTGHHNGNMRLWRLDDVLAAARAKQRNDVGAAQAPAPPVEQVPQEPLDLPGPLTATIECIRFLKGGRMAARGFDGRIAIWHLEQRSQPVTMRVPGGSVAASYKARCLLGHTADGTYLCAGNSNSEVYVYNTASGDRAGHVEAIKVSGPVRSCALSNDCRHLLAVVGNGFLFRFEYVKPDDTKPATDTDGSPEEETAGDALEE